MAITHLFEVGVKHLKDADVEKTCQQIMDTTPSNAFIAPEMSCAILRCSVELAQVPIWDILKFVKTNIEICGTTVHPGVVIEFRKNALGDLICSCIAPADTDEDALSSVEEAINMKIEEHERVNRDYYGFSYKAAIEQAFKENGIRLSYPEPDKVIYL